MQRRVLVIDDNNDAAELLQMLLEMEGYEVRVAFDGAQGLIVASSFLPEVICSDIGMPVMSGLELAQKIRGNNQSQGTHLVAITALADAEITCEIKASGFDACFTKPLDFRALTAYLLSIPARDDQHAPATGTPR
jgi:DNA-binding response OmpR family regulator